VEKGRKRTRKTEEGNFSRRYLKRRKTPNPTLAREDALVFSSETRGTLERRGASHGSFWSRPPALGTVQKILVPTESKAASIDLDKQKLYSYSVLSIEGIKFCRI
jgi:hypothetical protein